MGLVAAGELTVATSVLWITEGTIGRRSKASSKGTVRQECVVNSRVVFFFITPEIFQLERFLDKR